MNESTELVVTQQYQLGVLNVSTPGDVIKVASEVATQLANIITQKNLFKVIGGKKHVFVDGWTTLGAMIGIVPRHMPELSKDLPDGGYQETVELIRMSDGMVIGRGTALCGTPDEIVWNKRIQYAQKSMAITRATGKAFRISLSWIMVLAGFNATPAEEMDCEVEQPKQSKKAKPFRNTFLGQCTLAKDYFKLATGNDEIYNSIIGKFGFTNPEEVLKEVDQKAILNVMKDEKDFLENSKKDENQTAEVLEPDSSRGIGEEDEVKS